MVRLNTVFERVQAMQWLPILLSLFCLPSMARAQVDVVHDTRLTVGSTGNVGQVGMSIVGSLTGGDIVVGYRYGGDNVRKAIVTSVNKEGGIVWAHEFRPATSECSDGGTVIESWFEDVFRVDDGYVVVGTTKDPCSPYDYDGIVLRLDKEGNKVWSTLITGFYQSGEGTEETDDVLTAVIEAEDGSLYVVGYGTQMTGLLCGSEKGMVMAKLDRFGALVWQNQYNYGPPTYQYDPLETSSYNMSSQGVDVIELNNGHIAFLAEHKYNFGYYCEAGFPSNFCNPGFGCYSKRPLFVFTDANGSVLDDFLLYADSDTPYEWLVGTSLIQLPGDEIVMGGYVRNISGYDTIYVAKLLEDRTILAGREMQMPTALTQQCEQLTLSSTDCDQKIGFSGYVDLGDDGLHEFFIGEIFASSLSPDALGILTDNPSATTGFSTLLSHRPLGKDVFAYTGYQQAGGGVEMVVGRTGTAQDECLANNHFEHWIVDPYVGEFRKVLSELEEDEYDIVSSLLEVNEEGCLADLSTGYQRRYWDSFSTKAMSGIILKGVSTNQDVALVGWSAQIGVFPPDPMATDLTCLRVKNNDGDIGVGNFARAYTVAVPGLMVMNTLEAGHDITEVVQDEFGNPLNPLLQQGDVAVVGDYEVSNDAQLLVTKILSNGNPMWVKGFGKRSNDGASMEYGRSIAQTPDGGFIVGGYSNSKYLTSTPGGYNYYVLKLDWFGNIGFGGWANIYSVAGGVVNSNEVLAKVIRKANGGYLAIGYTDAFGSKDLFVLELSTGGAVTNSRVLDLEGQGYDDVPVDVQEDAAGNYYITGYSTISANDPDYSWLVKFDNQLSTSLLLAEKYEAPQDLHFEGLQLHNEGEGGLGVSGEYQDGLYSCAIVLALDLSGEIVWERKMPVEFPEEENDAFYDLDVYSDDFFAIGATCSFKPDVIPQKKADHYLVRLPIATGLVCNSLPLNVCQDDIEPIFATHTVAHESANHPEAVEIGISRSFYTEIICGEELEEAPGDPSGEDERID